MVVVVLDGYIPTEIFHSHRIEKQANEVTQVSRVTHASREEKRIDKIRIDERR